jgi:Ca2+-binding EF-hand superfamily protein
MSEEVTRKIDRTQMDDVEFDILLETVERRLRQKADEIGITRKKMESGGLMRFDTSRLTNDLAKVIATIEQAAPESYIQTYPKNADESSGANIDTTE